MTTITKPTVNVGEQAQKAQKASKSLAALSTKQKDEALLIIADELEANHSSILEENEKDLELGREKGYEQAFMDRLLLTKERIEDFANGLRELVKLKDPVGETVSEWTLENGLNVKNERVPLGVIGMIYEARPNVTVDATGLALKSGNAIVLKGGSSALNSNKGIISVIHRALEKTSIPVDAVQFIASTDREATEQLFTMKEHIDVLIPRGGGSLIDTVVRKATIPVLETGVGNVHVYVDKQADLKKALDIMINAKTDRPAVCNALETVIIHREFFTAHKETFISTFKEYSITVHGEQEVVNTIPGAVLAKEKDWAEEYLSLDIALKIVDDITEAVNHIEQYGTKHSEAVVTEDQAAADLFLNQVDAAAVYHNASTRFTDGSALGYGAEIGISTQKLHARGPMGLPALTTTKLKISGSGQVR
ncbi:glutamate-5-semialdehyde dehydrogenase [Alkalihalophilus pseudofirmus OF4]|uniref:Gamma-glutamyl phosphate reductase n=1 Tax=Alkalihalophilus pseudofirmus (strain ATCC BAA-2126 / JCM 17055 / OF4) TaxID=398511 RepID=D3FSR0_ALKPO|nr:MULTISPECIES: glutamate-5-semialdehyde dehydrogenase [Alkalihalophilus]ADC51775.1 glutamate-5-semialdehyde dehydrogenase [Alkalihalophilus pseudofirmus OF4]MED1600309.1 glutamate-5-semialdehyde dehydrogenase [Alkalihalophilus marmarensis]